jgi:hypothetical protein
MSKNNNERNLIYLTQLKGVVFLTTVAIFNSPISHRLLYISLDHE